MVRRLIRDESGMTMALVVMMIVLIGVMGAGLLVFVRNDLNAVIEVNQGQKALEAADAGIAAARRHLLVDSLPERYTDGDGITDSEWSYSGAGKTLTLDGNSVTVEIKHLPFADVECGGDRSDPNCAPAYEPEEDADDGSEVSGAYFRVISEGEAGNAKRKVDVILNTAAASEGIPLAYYAQENIIISGSSMRIKDVSIFAKGKICRPFATLESPNNPLTYGPFERTMHGRDLAYGDWQMEGFNQTPRSGDFAGMGAQSSIDVPVPPSAVSHGLPTGAPETPCTTVAGPTGKGIDIYQGPGSPTGSGEVGQKSGNAGLAQRYGLYDFDNGTGATAPGPRFVSPEAYSGTASQITYPFDPTAKPDVSIMKTVAQEQGNYVDPATTTYTLTAESAGGTFSTPSTSPSPVTTR